MGHAMGRKTKNLVGLSTYEVFLPSLAETKGFEPLIQVLAQMFP